jgi:hypothetical protein
MNVKIKIYKNLTYLEIGLKNGIAHVSVVAEAAGWTFGIVLPGGTGGFPSPLSH